MAEVNPEAVLTRYSFALRSKIEPRNTAQKILIFIGAQHIYKILTNIITNQAPHKAIYVPGFHSFWSKSCNGVGLSAFSF